jgi:hypothetical protein
MAMPDRCRRPIARFALLGATLTIGLVLPTCSSAAPSAARAEERAARIEERSARRAAQRASRLQQREARRTARSRERAERHAARRRLQAPPLSESEGTPPAQSVGTGQQRGPGQSSGTDVGCHLTAQASASQITVGETVTIHGKLSCANEAGAAEQTITVYGRQRASAMSVVGSATTSADGSYEFTSAALTANSTFSVRASLDLRARVVVKVGAAVTLAGPPAGAELAAASHNGHPRLRNKASFTGTVSPGFEGARVALQVAYVASGGQWRVAAYGRVDSEGNYSMAHAFKIPGEVSVRTVVHGGRLNAAATSEALSYDVAQPQNPALTITASADPLQYGQSVTISGDAAGAAGQKVVLLAQTHGSAPTAVGQTTTDGSGHYSFSQVPLEASFYRVSTGAATSTTLFESVHFALTPATEPVEARAGEQQTLSGTLSPSPPGQTLYLERQYTFGHGFYAVAHATVEANSEYKILYTFDRDGANVMRVRVPGDSEVQGAASEPFTVTVTDAP